jgi:ATP-dependent Clp protease ATP-binding subunit ClpB
VNYLELVPEFINRIDEIVMFTPLTNANIAQIVGLQLKSVKKMLALQGITLDATPEAIDYLSEKGYDPQFGARPVKRVIQRDVLNELSKEILSGKITTDSIVLIDAFDGKLVFRNQSHTDFKSSIATHNEVPKEIGKNKWLHTTDDFGKMERGREE